MSKPADYLPSRAERHADPRQPAQTVQMTVQQSRYRTALVRDQVERLELADEARAAELLRKWYLGEEHSR